MDGWIRRTWLGCVVALALGVPLAHADGGTIAFSGAVMVPTCSTSSVNIAVLSAGPRPADLSQQRFDCGGSAHTAANAPQSYTLAVEPLASSSLSTDRLISYFSGYVRAAGQENSGMRLVTQAYE